MTDKPNYPDRQSLRLKDYDYSQPGAYFVTLCAKDRWSLFGEIVDGVMQLNEAGRIVAEEWMKSAEIRQEIKLDEWVIMPNHFHGIVVITSDSVRAHGRAPVQKPRGASDRPLCRPPKSIGAMIAGFKSAATKHINAYRQTPGEKLWHRNYWEHVIRNEHDLAEICEYIRNNPAKWEFDGFYLPPWVAID
ncbi:MAG TPA: hypothetical protein ENL07_02550 [Chlorobaculum parvum]|uniref:Transposase IS200-like domain-containing protein n=1 Tax=Chlorobaculum parvum TaxID=274539 RepID=A0A7C5DDA7_9CHLB|nr:hypothetical protein [Chlorobaculum parvum]